MAQDCPVCLSRYSKQAEIYSASGLLAVNCESCGQFRLEEEAWEDYLDPHTGAGSKLSPVCRARLSHRIIQAGSIKPNSRPVLDTEFVQRFINDSCPGPSPAKQVTNLVKYIGDIESATGGTVDIDQSKIYAIIGAPNPNSAGRLFKELRGRQIINGSVEETSSGFAIFDISLTLSGWESYESEKAGSTAGRYGFIAMKFGDAVLDPLVTQTIKPVIKKAISYDVFDMRDVARAGIIDNIMRAQIRDSAFVIVDLTHDNSGAYWEAGYAEGLGKPVIYICERTKFDEAKTHFDTNHCTTVIWSNEEPEQFAKELVATLRRSLNLFEAGN